MEEEDDEDGGTTDVNAQRKGKSAVIKTSTRQVRPQYTHSMPVLFYCNTFRVQQQQQQTIFLPVPGLVDTSELKPGDLVGTNKDSYLILEKLVGNTECLYTYPPITPDVCMLCTHYSPVSMTPE